MTSPCIKLFRNGLEDKNADRTENYETIRGRSE